MTKKFNLPTVEKHFHTEKTTLPFNGNAVTEKSFSFSFACFDRSHELFNLGDSTTEGVVSGKWFLDLLDCLKSVSNKTIVELKSSLHRLHPITWSKTNTKSPVNSEQCEYWQFRINKSKGRIIGFLIEGVFYVTWLDPHHNLTNSEGYGGARKYCPPLSIYESQVIKIDEKENTIKNLTEEIGVYKELLNEK